MFGHAQLPLAAHLVSPFDVVAVDMNLLGDREASVSTRGSESEAKTK